MAASPPKYARLSRAELIAELQARDQRRADDDESRRALHELQVHQEEIAAQREQLIEAQHALEWSWQSFQDLFDFCPLAYVVLDAHGVIQRINLAGVALLEIERVRLENTPLLIHVRSDDRHAFLSHMRRCRQNETLTTTELCLKTRRGEEIAVELVSRPASTRRDEPSLYHTVATDLRERRRLEHERFLDAAERQRLLNEQQVARAASEAKDRFLAVLSHELRTPLTPIMLATSTWNDDPSLPAPIRKTLTMIRRNIGVQARLVDDLLDMTRIAQRKIMLQREVLDLHTIVEDVFDQANEEMAQAQLQGVLDLRAGDHYVSGDPLRLRQIAWNLVKNAIHFTPAGGRITVATANVRPGVVRLLVTDTGIGFDASAQANMFEPFHQGVRSTLHGGLGLGLAIARGLVEAHGGTITATSAGPDRGASFAVELLVGDEGRPALPAESVVDGRQLHQGPLKILLVEDHEDTAQALAYVLERQGYTVELAHSVAQAIAKSQVRDIDVVVSDLGLPDGSGLDLMRQLKARKSLPGIALTGYGRREDLDETTRAGFQRHLTKPVDVPTLIAAIESLRPAAA